MLPLQVLRISLTALAVIPASIGIPFLKGIEEVPSTCEIGTKSEWAYILNLDSLLEKQDLFMGTRDAEGFFLHLPVPSGGTSTPVNRYALRWVRCSLTISPSVVLHPISHLVGMVHTLTNLLTDSRGLMFYGQDPEGKWRFEGIAGSEDTEDPACLLAASVGQRANSN
ncbi:hypothetical protein EDD17DRAFT_1507188 [Pisolithus thermaeus]|nr:hypothetical protein EV401DRAFT_1887334 [Pisolithus croceorrhizus]KAI6126542.1 hypothetical protein F5141DRAFT_1200385 [Pisolithus sp. B1]KAI6163464.1 hypothetical protein EDD17DRAFT_1507188 [Pisolithus thermaeus]